MNTSGQNPVQLSVIVPILNEEDRLSNLLDMLGRQSGVSMELILCDGGSEDASAAVVHKAQRDFPFPCHFMRTVRGRGAQMNAGAAHARGDYLLFLHADSRFAANCDLQIAMQNYQDQCTSRNDLVAGHFHLKFEDAPAALTRKMTYWEVKATLDRQGCTHGDQGFLMHRDVFAAVGPFVEDWPVFEDTLFAESLRSAGRWILLSPELFTSARRFDSEGLVERQTLNALLMNFRDIGWRSYFETAKSIYRQQVQTGRLQLKPFLLGIREQLSILPLSEQVKLWYRTGRYVRSNAWQLVLARKVKSFDWHSDTATSRIEDSLKSFDRFFDLLTRNPVGYALAAFVTWLWFRLLALRYG